MGVEVTVLGSCGGYPRPGRACSGYLIRHGEGNLVLDLGMGSLSNMLLDIGLDMVSGVAITHFHPDHFVDLFAFYTGRKFNFLPPGLPVLIPSGSREYLEATLTGSTRRQFFEYFEVTEVADGRMVVGGFEIECFRVEHSLPAVGFRVGAGGAVVSYSGDSDLCDSLYELAREATLFICEATFTGQFPHKVPGHLFAGEAGAVAGEAGAGKLLITHVWPTFNEETAVEEARDGFKGPVESAFEGLTLSL